ncbi:hypothetical protein [Flammeovirga kamogawensis]|uniref:Lipoprotein n=1 Tax=Flammeovirga kamogawensis TaxID=373891 RepID=A0ABX8H1X1_9BACT|nr:hypothetical protein [Flammeovirga kamogawensis]QWG09901.1 hypothetical protein KM029_19665 [Flammeovirga kamogawensis]TRX65405.1 hypothetical protein EO216_23060 [Flammeovirga kamogawensis]
MNLIKYFFLSFIIISCVSKNDEQETREINETIGQNHTDLSKEDNILTEVDTSNFVTSNYGIGKVLLSYDGDLHRGNSYHLEFYESPNSTTEPSERLELNWNEENRGYVQVKGKPFIKITDYYIDEPDYIIHFNCLGYQNGFYEVVVNEKLHKTLWIKESDKFVFETWTEYLKSTICVSQLSIKNNPARALADSSANIVFEEEMCWVVLDFKGNWINVKYSPFDKDMEVQENKNFRAWIKWRDEDKLLIKYYLSY